MTLTDKQHASVIARAQHLCQRKYPGCLTTATTIQLAYTPEQLAALHRDPNSPDNWLACCTTCSQEGS